MNIEKRKNILLKEFENFSNSEEKYKYIISLGEKYSNLSNDLKTDQNKISGCQSNSYIHTFLENDKMQIEATSDALISKGLAGILIFLFNNVDPKIILKEDIKFFEKLNISGILTPTRSNGFYHMLNRIKQDALNFIIKTS
jgi:cysteine desulfuration protein SufE